MSDSIDYQNAGPTMNFLRVYKQYVQSCVPTRVHDRLMAVAMKAFAYS